MITNFYKALFSIFLMCVMNNAYSQKLVSVKSDTTESKKDTSSKAHRKASLKFGIDYLSNNVFVGRTDTVNTPVITPNIKYTFKSGVYFSGSLEILPNRKKNKLDGGDLALGYDFDLTDDLSGGVSYSKLFYSSTSTQVSSSISSTFNGNLDYDIADIVTASVSMDYNINKTNISNDFMFNFAISHDFIAEGIFGNKDILLISPMVASNSGTQNFYDGYLVRKKLKNAKRNAAQTKLFNTYTADLSQFKLLDYEISLPIEYKADQFIFHIIPTYALAENQFQSAAIQKILGLSSQQTVFYVEVGVALKF
jgi:hypothetical protein